MNSPPASDGFAVRLEAKGIVAVTGGRAVLAGVTITANGGCVTAVVGPNGAGKSTLLRILAGIERPGEGSVLLGGADLKGVPGRQRARLVAFVEQEPATDLDLRALDVVLLGRIPYLGVMGAPGARDTDMARAAMDSMGVGHLEDRSFAHLSGGERRRVLLARAIAQQPSVLVLDEPTNHLDIGAQLTVLEFARRVARGGMCVVLALHDLTLAAAFADRVVVLADGVAAAAGPPDEVLTPDLIARVFDVTASVLRRAEDDAPVFAYSRSPRLPSASPRR
ncbi:ABC transporter ATP-binding protein [Microbacterium sp.]|uniref:ABC transporter ATP-binding protein n=1 Tax=Microbacterium sp. TaxID=51671 RepID=UPI00281180F8|nr:ABC transporter ATP-binding protein [Microbacterium sp.]